MEMRVIRAGMQTTVQDLGRRGQRASGVPLSGAMDPFALRVANSLIGNPENAAALEFAFVGPELEFGADTVVALGGAECEGLPTWRLMPVRAGERIALGACKHGCRGYLAVAGGIAVEPWLGSRSTYLRGEIGGFEGRALRDGDVLEVAPSATRLVRESPNWRIDPRVLLPYAEEPTVRVVLGTHAVEFGPALFGASYKVSNQSDRMGVRLSGPPLMRASAEELLSAAVAPGTVQVPPDGQPLILMADAQTIGGYPRVAHVIAVDLPLVAQLRPGDSVRFTEIALDEAHKLALARERTLAILHEGLAQKLS